MSSSETAFVDYSNEQLARAFEDHALTCGNADARDLLREVARRLDGWRCYFCGEVFTTPGAAADHFGAERDFASPGCLVDYQVQQGGSPERGRGLLMALRKEQAEVASLRRELYEADDRAGLAATRLERWQRVLLDFMRPGYTVERVIDLIHAHTPDHGGLPGYCDKWPCTAISVLPGQSRSHVFTPPDDRAVEKGADPLLCIVCGFQRAELEKHGCAVRLPVEPESV